MKILMINSVCGIRSTGRICTDMAKEYEKKGNIVKIAYGREGVPKQFQKNAVRIGNDFDVKFNVLRTRVFDDEGFTAAKQTEKFLKWAEEYNPDILWLHNLHGYYINIELLFNWIKSRPNMEVNWFLHDCWAFTGHCAYFSMIKCDKWKSQCSNCIQKREYPSSFIKDNCKNNYLKKKKIFTGVDNLTIYTPSKWLADLVKQSFLHDYPVKVKYNTIDKNIFKPTPSNFREYHRLENKKIILGVASIWHKRKGLDDFIQLSEMLDSSYVIVLVGLTEKQIRKLPKNIIGLVRTNNVEELAKIYSAADIFVNPSKEETFGMTTLEALYCGTDAIVYKDTACEEVVNMYGGVAVKQSVKAIKEQIMRG